MAKPAKLSLGRMKEVEDELFSTNWPEIEVGEVREATEEQVL